jgi:hypothetical protein
MAKAGTKPGRKVEDISDAILTEWFRVMPASRELTEADILSMDMSSLTAAFNNVLADNLKCRAIIDGDGTTTKPLLFVVPRPPVLTLEDLEDYVANHTDFRRGMGTAMLFGCGR